MKNYTLPATDFDTYALSTLLWSVGRLRQIAASL